MWLATYEGAVPWAMLDHAQTVSGVTDDGSAFLIIADLGMSPSGARTNNLATP